MSAAPTRGGRKSPLSAKFFIVAAVALVIGWLALVPLGYLIFGTFFDANNNLDFSGFQRAYGAGIEERLTGAHETASWESFSWGASDRGASIRIPWAVEKAKKGWLEDRRPNANMDPYVVSGMIITTCCEALAEA